ncbi:MAG: hypothetical protein MK132_06525 [Lentisphaerales bacterium]|nr:hypothetical protein [Lentisphaerales bacterium]
MKFFVLFTIFLLHCISYSTTIDFMSVEEKCFHSDLVALVKVTQAGGLYAEYEIIESFKGQQNGKVILYDPPGPHGPWFPTVLYGEQYLIFASKNRELTQFISSSSTTGNPMALRKIKFDYRLPYYQGKTKIADLKDQGALLDQVKDFLSHSEEEQKMHFVREYILRSYGRLKKYPFIMRHFFMETNKDKILSIYQRLSSDQRWTLGFSLSSTDEIILARHKKLAASFTPNNTDKLDLMTLSELHKKWPEMLEKNKANKKTVFALQRAWFLAELNYGNKKIHFRKMTDEELSGFQDNIFYLGRYTQSDYLEEITARKLTLKPATLNKLFHQKIDNLGDKDILEYTYTIVSIGMPSEREQLLIKLKNKKFKFHHDQKVCLLAFLGDSEAQETIKNKILAQINLGVIKEISEEINALWYFDREYFIALAKHPIFQKEVIEKLLKEDPQANEDRVLKIIKDKPRDSIGYYFSSCHIRKMAPQLYKKYFYYLAPKYQINALAEQDSIDQTSLMKIIDSYKGQERRTIFQAFLLILEHNDKEAISYYQKHKTILNDEYLPYFAQLYCSRLKDDISQLEKIYTSNEQSFSHFALRYLFIHKPEKYISEMQKLLSHKDRKVKLKIAIILAEHGFPEAIDLLLNENLSPTQELDDHLLRRQLYILDGRLKSLLSNMSKGETNSLSPEALKEYWSKHRKSYVDPWRSILNENFCE